MALVSASSTTQILGRPWSLPSGAARPFSLTGWFRPLATVRQTFVCGFSAGAFTGTSPYAGMIDFGSTSAPLDLAVAADERDALAVEQFIFCYTNGTTTSSATAPLNIWYFGAVVFTSLLARSAYIYSPKLAGPLVQNGSGMVTATTYTNFTVGSVQPAVGDIAVAHLAEIGVWRGALSARDVANLASGMSPFHVGEHAQLASYYPLRGDLHDAGLSRIGLRDLGTAAYPRQFIDHPPVEQWTPGRTTIIKPAAVVSPTRFATTLMMGV